MKFLIILVSSILLSACSFDANVQGMEDLNEKMDRLDTRLQQIDTSVNNIPAYPVYTPYN